MGSAVFATEQTVTMQPKLGVLVSLSAAKV